MADNFMDPGAKPMIMIREDGMIDLHSAPRLEEIDHPMNFLENSGTQGHPAKKRQSKSMDYLG